MFSDRIQQKGKQIIPLCMNIYRQLETKASLLALFCQIWQHWSITIF